ncbi:hypothetical protein D3C87_2191400 [compost metagenome]
MQAINSPHPSTIRMLTDNKPTLKLPVSALIQPSNAAAPKPATPAPILLIKAIPVAAVFLPR